LARLEQRIAPDARKQLETMLEQMEDGVAQAQAITRLKSTQNF